MNTQCIGHTHTVIPGQLVFEMNIKLIAVSPNYTVVHIDTRWNKPRITCTRIWSAQLDKAFSSNRFFETDISKTDISPNKVLKTGIRASFHSKCEPQFLFCNICYWSLLLLISTQEAEEASLNFMSKQQDDMAKSLKDLQDKNKLYMNLYIFFLFFFFCLLLIFSSLFSFLYRITLV